MTLKTIVASLWRASFLTGSVIWLQACTPQTVTSTSSASYKEDLSKYRPQLSAYTPLKPSGNEGLGLEKEDYPAPVNHIKEEIDQIVDMTIDFNESRRFLNGYAVLVYSGTEKRESDRAANQANALGTGEFARTTFTSPIYKVKIGRFYSRLEAHKFLEIIKQRVPSALVVSEKIRIQ